MPNSDTENDDSTSQESGGGSSSLQQGRLKGGVSVAKPTTKWVKKKSTVSNNIAKKSSNKGKNSKKAKKKRASSGEPEGPKQVPQRVRMPNFQPHEDLALMRAFIRVSEDPMKGCNQTADTLWESIKELYDSVLAEEMANSEEDDVFVIVERTADRLKYRFQKTILTRIQLFNGIYKAVIDKNESGKTDSDRMQDALLDNFEVKTVENLVVSVSRSTRMESDQFSAEQGPQAISVVVLNDL